MHDKTGVTLTRLILITALLLASPFVAAGDPGRLEDDSGFLLGHWSNNCKAGAVRIFLKDGALRQQGLVQLVAPGTHNQVSPVTLLAATRDGANIVLEAKTKLNDVTASSRYSGLLKSTQQMRLKNMTLCRNDKCRSIAIDVPWQRCP